MDNSNFCHTHLHSEFSLLDGVGSSEQYAKKASEMGFEYLACTNHGNIDGLIKHQKACEAEGIVSLAGIEMYIVPDMSLKDKNEKFGHITILIKNQIGWREIGRLLTIANIDGFYKRPRIDYKAFLDADLSGFIVLTGCANSFLNKKFGEGFFWNLCEEIKKDLYLEVMPHDDEGQKNHNKKCKELSEKYGIELVGSNDVHYPNKDDDVAQEVLLAIQSHAKWNDKDRWKFEVKGLHLKSYDEMVLAFKKQNVLLREDYLKSLRNTIKIAEKCKDFRIEKQQVSLPKVKRLKKYKGMGDKELLILLCDKRKNKLKNWNSEYEERLKYELEVILKKKFEGYFLIVWDLVRWCKKNDILLGSSRGSVGGCIVAFLLGIHSVDPIKHNLLFSRFINEERVSEPDVDLDFEDKKRDKIREYLENRYGKDNVSGISTFLKMKGRATIRDVARVFDIPLKEADEFAKVIEYGEEESAIKNAIKNTPEGRNFQRKYPKETELAIKLEGTEKSSGVHPAAIIISSENLKNGTRGNLCRRKDTIVSNWDMEDSEYVGLMKLDVLGLSTLSVLSETKRLVLENQNKEIKFKKIPIKDKSIFKMLSEGNTIGVFQLSTPLSTDICKELKIDCFEDISSVLAIARPGALHSGMAQEVIRRKHSGDWVKKHPLFEEITKDTYSCIIYQEQVMQVFHRVAGLSYNIADNIRKIIGKKRDVKEFEKYRLQFAEGCKKMKTFNEREVKWFWDMLLKCANYLFNKCLSHNEAIYGKRDKTGRYITIGQMFKIRNNKKYAIRTGHKSLHNTYNRYGYGDAISLCDDGRLRKNKIIDIYFSGKMSVYKVMLKGRKYLKCTMNHSIPFQGGVKKLSDFKIGEKIFVKRKSNAKEEWGQIEEKEIISIKYVGEEDCYDVEMSSPNHNFLTGRGIVVSNSHSVGYAMLAVWTAHCKYYYPTEFISACLTYGSETKKEEMIAEARRLNLKILPPKIGISDSIKWKAKDGNLYAPFIEIKGFGETTAKKCMLRSKPVNQGFFSLFSGGEQEIKAKTKVDKILNEIKAYDKDVIPKGINKYFSFEIDSGNKIDINNIKILEKTFKGYEGILSECKKCELIKECNKPIYPSIGKYNIIVAGESGGYEENQQGRGFVGRSGKLLWEELSKYELERKMFHVTNVCKCSALKSKTPNEKQIKICFDSWLKEEINSLGCKLILAFGNTGLMAFRGIESGIMKMNGKIEWSSKAEAWICHVVHPAGVLRGGIERRIFNDGVKVFVDKFKELKGKTH